MTGVLADFSLLGVLAVNIVIPILHLSWMVITKSIAMNLARLLFILIGGVWVYFAIFGRVYVQDLDAFRLVYMAALGPAIIIANVIVFGLLSFAWKLWRSP